MSVLVGYDKWKITMYIQRYTVFQGKWGIKRYFSSEVSTIRSDTTIDTDIDDIGR